MESTNVYDMGWDIGITFVVFTLYIVGKVWMYYRMNDNESTKNKGNKE
jgi:hypothetical protein